MEWDRRALAVLEALHNGGHRAVLVGGCVRDSLLGIPLHDYDACTSALPEEIKAACRGFRCVDTGIRHGTVTVISEGLPVEVTTFRTESGYSDHRRPDRVEFTDDLTLDLGRRDFTINALAWEPHGITDPWGGQADLQQRCIRCVGDPDRRFEEDALRILRGLRLAAQLEFTIDGPTTAAIHSHAGDLGLVAWERISGEFVRLLCSPGAEQILLDYPDVVGVVLPELAPAMGFDQHTPHHVYDVYTHCVKALSAVPPTPVLRLAALLHDVGKPPVFSMDEHGTGHFYNHVPAGLPLAEQALTRLRLDTRTREQVLLLIQHHHLPVECSRKWVGRWLSRLGEDIFFDLLALKQADSAACAPHPEEDRLLTKVEALARNYLTEKPCLSLKELAVNGRDAMEAGLRGRSIGLALRSLLDRVAQGELQNDRSILLGELKKASPN